MRAEGPPEIWIQIWGQSKKWSGKDWALLYGLQGPGFRDASVPTGPTGTGPVCTQCGTVGNQYRHTGHPVWSVGIDMVL